MAITAVILAAGAGSRLGELGRRYSKPTLPILGQPLIHWVIAGLRAAGVERLVVVGHPSDARLATYLRDNHPPAVLVTQAQRRGIADALRHALPLVAGEAAYLACACDSLFVPADVARVIACGCAEPGIAVIGTLDMGVEATSARSALRVDGRLDGGRVLAIVEKPAAGSAPSGVVAMPLYWLPRSFARHIDSATPRGSESYISTALNAFVLEGGIVRTVQVSGRLEVTTAEDVDRAAAWVREHGR